MKEISEIIQDMMENARKLIDESKQAIDQQKTWRDNFFARANNTQDSTLKLLLNALAIQHSDDGLLYSKIRRTVRLTEMNMILIDALNRAIEKMEEKFPQQMEEIKTELSKQVQDKLGEIHTIFQEEKKQDEEINKAAKEREKHIGGMFG
jgi:hypothetical protein